MFDIKIEQGIAYIKDSEGNWLRISNEQFLTATKLMAGLMSPDHVNAITALQEQFNRFQGLPVSHITFNNNQGSTLKELAVNPTPRWMWSVDNVNVINQVNSVPDPIQGTAGRRNWAEWAASVGYYHNVYSATARTYVMKFDVPDGISAEDRRRTIVEITFNNPTADGQIMIGYNSTQTGWIRRSNTVKVNRNVQKFYYHLQEGPTSFYILLYTRGGGIPSIRLLSLENAQEHLTSGPYDAKPTSPILAQQYFCTDYNSRTRGGNGTEKQLLIFNGTSWQKANE